MIDFDVKKHRPEYQYHCERCKFSWCCGYVCSCNYKKALPDPPILVQKAVNEMLKRLWYVPQFSVNRDKGSRR